jgi:CHAT domain-containing protein
MLALSACSTAAQLPDANGRELDGFAELAQRKKAGAVLASLWNVPDESTAELMAEFYRRRQIGRGMTKAAALRQAQLALLRGEGIGAELAKRSSRSSEPVKPEGKEKDALLYKPDPKRPNAHPYYWAPFILFGNWR